MARKQQTILLTQTLKGYAVRRWSGNKTLSSKHTRTLKEADKVVTSEKRKALKETGVQPRVTGIARQTKTIKKKKSTRRKSNSYRGLGGFFGI